MILIGSPFEPGVEFEAPVKQLPGGEFHPGLDSAIATWKSVRLTAHIDNGDVMELLTVTDAIRRLRPKMPIHLVLPYLPYARQDRVPNLGESLTLKVFCDVINGQNYDTVSVLDVHSDVGVALLDRVYHTTLPQVVAKCLKGRDWSRTVLVAPDAGAMKKTYELAKAVGCPNVVQAFKTRDTVTGKITGTEVHLNFKPTLEQDWLVVDDICDGGYTFVELAKVLRAKLDELNLSNRLELWVTHGMFTKGYDELKKHYGRIVTTNSFRPTASFNTRPDGETDAAIYWYPVKGIL